MRFGLLVWGAALCALSSAARADVTARYASSHPDGPNVTIHVANDGRARMEATGRDDLLLITRDGVRYLVARDSEGTIVARFADNLALQRARSAANDRPYADLTDALDSRISIETEERGTETIAGYQGALRVVLMSGIGEPVPMVEVVVSSDPGLAQIGREIAALVDEVAGSRPAADSTAELMRRLSEIVAQGTPLRVDSLRLVSLSRDPVPDSAFDLPGPVLDRAALAAQMRRLGPRTRPPPAPPGTVPVPVYNPAGPEAD